MTTVQEESPFQTQFIWIDSLLLQLEKCLLREDTTAAEGNQEILESLGVDANLIAEARLRGTITHDEVDPGVIAQIKCDAETCQNANHKHN